MSKQILTDEQKNELCSVLETGDVLQAQQLIRIGFPGVDACEILRKRVQKMQDDPEIWGQLGYKEGRRKPCWLRSFQRCCACGTLILFSPHETFFCGHLDCQSKDASCCPICGPVFDQLWEFLAREVPEPSKVEWPSIPDNLFDETEILAFARSVVQAHRLAFQKIPIEALVSFALNGSPTGVISFLESHKDLAIQVEESRVDDTMMWAWDRASREVHRFELLKQALQTGIQGKPEQWNVLNPTESCLFTKTLSSIREMFEKYSPSGFSKRLPLLSRRLIREGTLDTDFKIYDEITQYSSRRTDEGIVQVWRQRSRQIHERRIQLLDGNVYPDGEEYFQHCKAVLHDDVVDILSVYPHLCLAFVKLAEVLYSHRDYFSCGIIITGIEQFISIKWNINFTITAAGAKQSTVPFEIRYVKLAQAILAVYKL